MQVGNWQCSEPKFDLKCNCLDLVTSFLQLFFLQALQHALQQQQQNIQQHLQNLLLLQSAGTMNIGGPPSPILANQVKPLIKIGTLILIQF